jgi:hypothetical protein
LYRAKLPAHARPHNNAILLSVDVAIDYAIDVSLIVAIVVSHGNQ